MFLVYQQTGINGPLGEKNYNQAPSISPLWSVAAMYLVHHGKWDLTSDGWGSGSTRPLLVHA